MLTFSLQTISLISLDFFAASSDQWRYSTEERHIRPVLKILGLAVAYLLGILIVSISIADISPKFGLFVAWFAAVITLIALIKPIKAIGLGHRGVATTAFISALLTVGAVTEIADDETEKHLVVLEKENPAQYLVELKEYDRDRWLSELKRLYPERHNIEMKQIEREKSARRAKAKARQAVEKAEQIEKGCRSDFAQIEAYSMVQDFVVGQLKSPSTAKFPNSTKVTVLTFGECSFKIGGYVDAQNGFGAMIRTRYVAEITRIRYDDHRWRFDGVQFR